MKIIYLSILILFFGCSSKPKGVTNLNSSTTVPTLPQQFMYELTVIPSKNCLYYGAGADLIHSNPTLLVGKDISVDKPCQVEYILGNVPEFSGKNFKINNESIMPGVSLMQKYTKFSNNITIQIGNAKFSIDVISLDDNPMIIDGNTSSDISNLDVYDIYQNYSLPVAIIGDDLKGSLKSYVKNRLLELGISAKVSNSNKGAPTYFPISLSSENGIVASFNPSLSDKVSSPFHELINDVVNESLIDCDVISSNLPNNSPSYNGSSGLIIWLFNSLNKQYNVSFQVSKSPQNIKINSDVCYYMKKYDLTFQRNYEASVFSGNDTTYYAPSTNLNLTKDEMPVSENLKSCDFDFAPLSNRSMKELSVSDVKIKPVNTYPFIKLYKTYSSDSVKNSGSMIALLGHGQFFGTIYQQIQMEEILGQWAYVMNHEVLKKATLGYIMNAGRYTKCK